MTLFFNFDDIQSHFRYRLSTAVQNVHSAEKSSVGPAQNLRQLERALMELEIDLKRLDLDLSQAALYGWREDTRDKLIEWRENLSKTFSKWRESMNKFFKSLTSRDGERLPDWVYTGFGGALEEVVKYLEERMAKEDDHFRGVVLEVIRNSVRIYRNKVKSASEKAEASESSSSSSTSSSSSSSTPAPSEEL